MLLLDSSENNQPARMRFVAAFALVVAFSAAAFAAVPQYSFSPPVGSSYGRSYTTPGEGRITGIRVWFRHYIRGIQFRHGFIWSPVAGHSYGHLDQMELFDDEAIVQISGKYTHYMMLLVFTTNRGRFLYAGQPSGYSFNMYPRNEQAELAFISGRAHYGVSSLGAHWAVINPSSNGTARH